MHLGRSMSDLVLPVGELEGAGVDFESLTEKIDATTATGRLVFHLFSARAKFERNLIRDRTNAGLASRGRKAFGQEKQAAIKAMGKTPPSDVCKVWGLAALPTTGTQRMDSLDWRGGVPRWNPLPWPGRTLVGSQRMASLDWRGGFYGGTPCPGQAGSWWQHVLWITTFPRVGPVADMR